MKYLLFIIGTLLLFHSIGQNSELNVIQYDYHISVNDSNDVIQVKEQIELVTKNPNKIRLDLYGPDSDGYGMILDDTDGALLNDRTINYSQELNKLLLTGEFEIDDTLTLVLNYSGIPKTGLIISENKFGERTFFGDNWPNRAHHWIASNDHPSDKALINFTINAPSHYDCVATGTLVKTIQSGAYTTHFYKSDIELPTKVMVLGLAHFSIQKVNYSFPLENWVYDQDSALVITDLAPTVDILNYYTSKIAPYPFEKLFNVQSTTQFGGMENAGNIFYDEGAYNGKHEMEALIAHEIAHQWFGNSASEIDWHHLWLSEGFATYFTDLYFLEKYGKRAMNDRLASERERVIRFNKVYNHPVVDTTYNKLMDLLNPNSYQRGAWVLHMLRLEIGDEAFWRGIRAYYEKYKMGNASTLDFKEEMEMSSKINLTDFFNQWLYAAEIPKIFVDIDTKKKNNCILIQQKQHLPFSFDLVIELKFSDGTTAIHQFPVDQRSQVYELNNKQKIVSFVLDPSVQLLFEEVQK